MQHHVSIVCLSVSEERVVSIKSCFLLLGIHRKHVFMCFCIQFMTCIQIKSSPVFAVSLLSGIQGITSVHPSVVLVLLLPPAPAVLETS